MSAEPAGRRDAGLLEVDGARLAYRIEGQGQPCLVLGSVGYYSRVLSPQLRDRLQLVFVDLRHFAASDPGFSPDQISIDLYAADVERARRALGLGHVIVIGHSVHATVALEYARRYPAHVRGVIVFGSTPQGTDEADDALDEQFWQEAAGDRRALRAQKKAELTPELRASLSPAEFFVREYVARAPLHFYDMTYDGTWLWEGTELNMPGPGPLLRSDRQIDPRAGRDHDPGAHRPWPVRLRFSLAALGEAPTQAASPHLRAVRQERPFPTARGTGRGRRDDHCLDRSPRVGPADGAYRRARVVGLRPRRRPGGAAVGTVWEWRLTRVRE